MLVLFRSSDRLSRNIMGRPPACSLATVPISCFRKPPSIHPLLRCFFLYTVSPHPIGFTFQAFGSFREYFCHQSLPRHAEFLIRNWASHHRSNSQILPVCRPRPHATMSKTPNPATVIKQQRPPSLQRTKHCRQWPSNQPSRLRNSSFSRQSTRQSHSSHSRLSTGQYLLGCSTAMV